MALVKRWDRKNIFYGNLNDPFILQYSALVPVCAWIWSKKRNFSRLISYKGGIPNEGNMINRTDILRKYHDHAITIKLSRANKSISGRIVDDSPEDHCVLVRDPDLVKYYETKEDSLVERIYFKDVKAIEYQ
jgi:hypothetical protein